MRPENSGKILIPCIEVERSSNHDVVYIECYVWRKPKDSSMSFPFVWVIEAPPPFNDKNNEPIIVEDFRLTTAVDSMSFSLRSRGIE